MQGPHVPPARGRAIARPPSNNSSAPGRERDSISSREIYASPQDSEVSEFRAASSKNSKEVDVDDVLSNDAFLTGS